MNTSKSSYKRLMSLVLSMLMIVAMLSVSADAVNKYIYVNGELAENNAEYNENVTVAIKGIDLDTVTVKVNGEKVSLAEDGTFGITVAEGVVEEETADPEKTDTPDTADTADTADNSSKTPAASGANADDTTAADDGKYDIVVYDEADNNVSAVTIFVKEKDESPDPDQSPDPEKPTPDPEKPTPDPEKPTPDPEKPTPDPEKPTPDPEKPTPDPEKPTPDPEKPTPDPEKPTPDPEKPTPDPLKPFYGDVNLDGKVTAKDSLLAQRYAIKLEKLNDQQLLNGDVNGDGKVTAADAFLILRHAVKIINTFPVEAK